MGLPAVDMTKRTRSSRPRLHVVKPASRRGRRSRRDTQAVRQGFALCCVLLAGVALFGLGRVMLAARATEASMRSSELRQDIKAERLVGDMLEVDCSALAVPSRIESIAGTTMQMAEASNVEYMAMPVDAEVADAGMTGDGSEEPAVQAAGSVSEDGLAGVLASLMDMAAGEAQVLLVGDVGIASPE